MLSVAFWMTKNIIKIIINRKFYQLQIVAMAKIKTICIDLSGTLHVDDQQTPGAIEALNRWVYLNTIYLVRVIYIYSKFQASSD